MYVDYYCNEVDRELSRSEQATLNLYTGLVASLLKIEEESASAVEMPVSSHTLHLLMDGVDALEQELVDLNVLERVHVGSTKIDEDGGPLSVV